VAEANYGRDKLWLVGCLDSEPRLAPSQKRPFVRRLGKATAPGEGSADRAPTLRRIPWHLPYNWGKSRKTSVRVAEKRSADQRRTRFVWSTIQHCKADVPFYIVSCGLRGCAIFLCTISSTARFAGNKLLTINYVFW